MESSNQNEIDYSLSSIYATTLANTSDCKIISIQQIESDLPNILCVKGDCDGDCVICRCEGTCHCEWVRRRIESSLA